MAIDRAGILQDVGKSPDRIGGGVVNRTRLAHRFSTDRMVIIETHLLRPEIAEMIPGDTVRTASALDPPAELICWQRDRIFLLERRGASQMARGPSGTAFSHDD